MRGSGNQQGATTSASSATSSSQDHQKRAKTLPQGLTLATSKLLMQGRAARSLREVTERRQVGDAESLIHEEAMIHEEGQKPLTSDSPAVRRRSGGRGAGLEDEDEF